MKTFISILLFTIMCFGFGVSTSSAKSFKFVIEGEMTAEERVVLERSLDEFQYFCRSLMGPLKKDIKTATAEYRNRCRYCKKLGWDRVILLTVELVSNPSASMPANIDPESGSFEYVIHKDGVLVYKGATQNLCGIRHSEPTAVLLKNDGTVESVY